jgi:GT2 family glycosyltransferase
MNELQLFFESYDHRLMHKWVHYFEIYDRHFSKFRNTDVHVVEIGVYHGGSLQMWRNYFGPHAKITGVDIDSRCKPLEEEGVEIIIGNQEDGEFLASLRSKLPRIDILIDDGGHTMRQQIRTFEELFPHVSENGIYLCEDLHTSYWTYYNGGFRNPNNFIEYSKGLIDFLNAWHSKDTESFPVTSFTRSAYSMNFYGGILVIEKRPVDPPRDRMIGHPSFAEDEILQTIEWVEARQPLEFEKHNSSQSLEGKLTELNARYFELLDVNTKSQVHIHNIQNILDQTRDTLHQFREQLQQSQIQLGQTEIELQQNQNQLYQTQLELEQSKSQLYETQTQLHQTQTELERSQSNLHQTQTELERSQSQLQHKQTKLEGSQSQLHQTQIELEQVQSAIQKKQNKIEELRSRLQTKRQERDCLHSEIEAMKTSKFWKLRNGWFKFKGLFGLVENSTPTSSVVANTETASPKPVQQPQPKQPDPQPQPPSRQDLYEQWMIHNTPTEADLKRMADIASVFAYKPLISIVMPVYNTPEQFLRESIASVIAQIYPHWELCIADDASTEPHIKPLLEEFAAKDDRIKVVYREENGHISRCSNSALELAIGEFMALLDHDDLLTPEALYEVVFLLNKHSEADMIYSDEDKLNEQNKRCDPYFKPDWCPDTFLSRMYTCHLGVYRRSIINEIGGFREGYEGSQDYDLVLRFTEKTDNIFHIPKILYHWRIHSQSAASSHDAKPYTIQASEKALTDALNRRGTPGKVLYVSNSPGFFNIRYEILDYKLVSIIIPTKDLGHILNQCLESIFTKSTYPNYEIILIDNGSVEPYTGKVISDWLNKEPERFRCYAYGIPFNYSKINNYAVRRAKGDFLLFLNNDTEVITPDWIEAMVEQAQRPSIGAIGALLLYPEDTIQHAGVVLGIGSVADHSHRHIPSTSPGYFGQVITVNNYSAVTGACLMCRRDVFEAVEGFNEDLAVAFNDIDLCLKILNKGYRNIYLPHVVLYHYESKSRGYDTTPEKRVRFISEAEYMKQTWKQLIDADPCYNPNLSLTRHDFSLREPEDRTSKLVHDLHNQLNQAQRQLKRSQNKLQQTKEELEQAQNRISAMETSKFWKLRKRWFQLKRLTGIPGQE